MREESGCTVVLRHSDRSGAATVLRTASITTGCFKLQKGWGVVSCVVFLSLLSRWGTTCSTHPSFPSSPGVTSWAHGYPGSGPHARSSHCAAGAAPGRSTHARTHTQHARAVFCLRIPAWHDKTLTDLPSSRGLMGCQDALHGRTLAGCCGTIIGFCNIEFSR